MSTRFLVALCIVVFHALLGSWPEAHAQVQNGSVFNSEGPGPNPGHAGETQTKADRPDGSTAGAIQAVAADPSRPGTIYVGAANGGMWKATNGGTSWTPLIAQKASLSIASLAFDPTDPTHPPLMAGTGLTSNGGFAASSRFGTPENFGGLQNGLLYSRDGGTTWTRLGETTLSGQSVVDVAARGSTILAATFEPRVLMKLTGGLYRSSNSGGTFTEVSGAPGSGLPAGPVSSLVSDPSNRNVFYAAVTANSINNLGQASVYVSRNAGATWQRVFTGASSGGLIPSAAAQMHQTFIRIGAGPNQTVGVGLGDVRDGRLIGLFYSSNAGANWRRLITPKVNPGGQAAVNLALAIDPNNSNLVYVMGDNVAGGGEQDMNGNNLESALAIFRVNAATNTASRISDDNNATGNTGNGSFVHADGRAFAFDANGQLLTSTDGGLYARTNPQSSTGVWKGLQGNLSVMELYALAFDANSKRLVVAMQDNGGAYQSAPGSSRFNVAVGGDGLNAVVNDVTLGSDSAIYVSSQELFLRRLIVDETGRIISSHPQFGVSVAFNMPVQGTAFSSPFVLNNVDKTRIAVAGSAVYVTQDTLTGANGPAAPIVNLSLTKLGHSNEITAIDYGTRNNANALLAGATNRTLYLLPTAAPP